MSARLRYPEVSPAGFEALSAFGHAIHTGSALEPNLITLVELRASHLNGCDFCIAMHTAELLKHNEPQTRIDAVLSQPASDAFTPRERAALAWTETLTRLTGTHASDDEYAAVSTYFQGKDLVDLTYAIASINAWNRLGIAFKPEWKPKKASPIDDAGQAAADDTV